MGCHSKGTAGEKCDHSFVRPLFHITSLLDITQKSLTKPTHLVNPSALHLIVSPIIFWCFPPDPALLWVWLSLFLVHNLSKYPFLYVMDEWNYQFSWSESSSLDKFGSLCTFQIYRTWCTDRDRGSAVELIIFSTLSGRAVMSASCSSRWGLNVRSGT